MSDARRQRVTAVFERYDAQGVHRTGSAVDEASARWLAEELRSAGVEPLLTDFPLERIDPVLAELRLGERRIPGTPLFDCGYTGDEGIRGPLGRLGSDAAIAVGMLPPQPAAPEARQLFEARQSGEHRALVAITDGSDYGLRAGLTLMNAEHFSDPFGPPVLQVPSDVAPVLLEAADAGREGQLLCRVERTAVRALNVSAQLPGSRGEGSPLVVMTPRSGWWHCASERGGGLACWLEILHELRSGDRAHPALFIATSGHELGHIGLEHYLAGNADLLERAHVWIHLGANFAAAGDAQVRLQASDDELEKLARRHLFRAGAPPFALTPTGSRPFGEARNVFDGGGRYLSLLGSNPLFHHPDDRWPDAVDIDKTLRLIEALTGLARELSGS